MPGAVLRQLLQEEVPAEPVAAARHFVDRIAAPTLVVIDDAENADTVSLQALTTAVRHHRDLPLLVVLGMTARHPLVADLISDELRLEGLDAAAVAELAAARQGPAPGDGRGLDAAHPRQSATTCWPCSTRCRPRYGHGPTPSCRPHRMSWPTLTRGCSGAARRAGAGRRAGDPGETAPLARPRSWPGSTTRWKRSTRRPRQGLLTAARMYEPRLRDPLTRAAVVGLMGAHAAADAHRRAAEVVADPVRRLRHRVAATPIPGRRTRRRGRPAGPRSAAPRARGRRRPAVPRASRFTPDPLLRDERLTRSVDALVAAGDCGGAAALVPAVESLRETPLRNAVLAYLAIVRGRAAEAEVRLRRAWDIVNVERDPGNRRADRPALRAALVGALPRRGAGRMGRPCARAGRRGLPAGIEAAAIRGLGLGAAGHRRAPRGLRRPGGPSTPRPPGAANHHGPRLAAADQGRHRRRPQQPGGRRRDGQLGGSSRIALWALGWLARVQFLTGEWDRALHERGAGQDAGRVERHRLGHAAAGVDTGPGARAARRLGRGRRRRCGPRMWSPRLRNDADPDAARPGADRRGRGRLCQGAASAGSVDQDGGGHHDRAGLWPWAGRAGQRDGHRWSARGRRRVLASARGAGPRARAPLHHGPSRLRAWTVAGRDGRIGRARRASTKSLALLDGLPLRYDLAGSTSPTVRRCAGPASAARPTC